MVLSSDAANSNRPIHTTSLPPLAGWNWATWRKPGPSWPRSARPSKSIPTCWKLRWPSPREEKHWDEALQIAQALVRRAPKRSSGWLHQAYALRRVPDGGIQKAWEALLPAFDKFPKEPTIPFNLSCYACQLRQLDVARDWLKRALAVGGKEKIKQMALEDSDLEPLWSEIRQL